MALRKHLEGGRITRVSQVGFDRILRMEIQQGSGLYILIGEFMGRHSNVILIPEDGLILAAAKYVSLRKSRYRVVLPGQPYVPPPPAKGALNPLDDLAPDCRAPMRRGEEKSARETLMQTYQGLSPFLAYLIVYRAVSTGIEESWRSVFGPAREGLWSPVLVRDLRGNVLGAYPIRVRDLPGVQEQRYSRMGTALTEAYERIAQVRSATDLRQKVSAELEDAIRIRRKQIADAEAGIDRARAAGELRRKADLLVAAGPAANVSGSVAEVPDYYGDGKPVRIPLVAGATPRETAAIYYERARKAECAAGHLQSRRETLIGELSELENAKLRLDTELDTDAVQELANELASRNLIRLSAKSATPPPKSVHVSTPGIRTFRTTNGWEVLVGLNAEANDRLLRLGAPDDLWFHVRSGTSAHVLIRTLGHPERVPHAVIEFAACLAAQQSPAKHSSYVAVDYTLRKYVRRVKGAAPGRVIYSNEKTIGINPEECRDTPP